MTVKITGAVLGLASLVAMAAGCAGASAAELDYAKMELGQGKVGLRKDLGDIKPLCGDKKLRVAMSVGWGGNSWFKIARKEFEVEAAKCPNITEVAYTDGQGNPEQQIADVQSLAAQGFDVIVAFPGGGEALVRAMRQAMKAGAVVVPYATGRSFPGEPGKDYVLTVTDDNQAEAELLAQWLADKLKGKGNVIMYGGTPGNSLTASELVAVKKVFGKYPDIKLLEEPVVTNWVPSEYTTKTTGVLSKYPKIDAIFSDFGLGVMGALRAFKAAGRPIPLVVAQDGNELACFWEDNKTTEPGFQIATINYSGPWMAAWGLRKGLAAINGMKSSEPTIIQETMAEDSTNPALAPKCNRGLPPDALPANTTLTDEQLKQLLAK